jgi:hypothetical protein
MKIYGLGASAALLLGIYAMGSGSKDDFERTINRPPSYAFEAISDGTEPLDDVSIDDVKAASSSYEEGTVTFDYKEKKNESISLAVFYDKQPSFDVNMRFEPLDDGKRTKLLMNIAVHPSPLNNNHSKLPSKARRAVNSFLDGLVGKLNRGDILNTGSTIRQQLATPQEQSYATRRSTRAAAAPMTSARPMVDPDRVARDHMRKEGISDGY